VLCVWCELAPELIAHPDGDDDVAKGPDHLSGTVVHEVQGAVVIGPLEVVQGGEAMEGAPVHARHHPAVRQQTGVLLEVFDVLVARIRHPSPV
jgi:hypothetical protein